MNDGISIFGVFKAQGENIWAIVGFQCSPVVGFYDHFRFIVLIVIEIGHHAAFAIHYFGLS